MARARNIKPGFFTNEELVEIEPLGRLLFMGLWTIADREGRLEDRPKRIKMQILPGDETDINALLDALDEHGFITRYEAYSEKYIQIINFVKHQQPHYKEPASVIPPPDGWEDSGVVSFGVPEAQRQRIFERDGRKCLTCGATERLSVDHIIPRSRGGSGDDSNLQTLCMSCNASKNNRLASESASASLNVGSTSGQRRVDESGALPSDSLNTDSLIARTPPTPPKGGQAASEPFRLFQAFCEITGTAEGDVPAATKSKQLGIAKRLLGRYGWNDAMACIRWLATWREAAWDLSTVSTEIDKWIMSGRKRDGRISKNGPAPMTGELDHSKYTDGKHLSVRGG